MDTAVNAPVKVPLGRRINFRLIIFTGVMLVLVGYPAYLFVSDWVTGGVTRSGDYLAVNLKALGNFPFDAASGDLQDVPDKWRALDGKKVLLEGEVWAPNEAGDRMTRFELVYSIAKCCFGGPPKVQERVYVTVPADMKVPNLTNYFARVTGTLHVTPRTEDGQVVELYTLELDRIEQM